VKDGTHRAQSRAIGQFVVEPDQSRKAAATAFRVSEKTAAKALLTDNGSCYRSLPYRP